MSYHNRNPPWQQQRTIPQPRFGGCPVGPIFSGVGRAGTSISVNASAGVRAKQCWIEFALLLFVLGFAFLSYLYGVASSELRLFPFKIIRDAWIAGNALYDAAKEEFNGMPPGALAFETKSAPLQVALNVRPPDQGLILMTGGPYKLMAMCPELGCMAWIMDRSGSVYHSWPLRRDAPWGDLERHHGFTTIDNIYPEGLHLYDNGDLLVGYQARNTYPYSVGLAKFDKNAKLLWQRESLTHHWFYVDRKGLIYAPSHELTDSPLPIPGKVEPLSCEEGKIYEDSIIVLDSSGALVRKFSVLRSLLDSGYGGLVYLTKSPCDPLHLNDVRVLEEEDASEYPRLSQGDMLISIRNLNTVAVIDATSTRIKWIASGLTLRQHAPRYLRGNRILVFDNLGGSANQGGSRLAEIDLASHAVTTLFPRVNTPPELDFFSEIAGHVSLDSERSRALVSLTMQGRIVEVDLRTGEVLWEYEDTYDVTPYTEASGKGADQRFARFGFTGAYYVETTDFLSDGMKQAAVPR